MNVKDLIATATHDSGWQYTTHAKPERGLHDFQRLMTFPKELTLEEMDAIKKYLEEEDKTTPVHYDGLHFSKMFPNMNGSVSYCAHCERDSS